MNTNWDIKEFENTCSSMKTILQKVQERRQNTPGTMNTIDLMNRSHLENQHSNILAFLLDPDEKHHHPEFGTNFLSLLKAKGLALQGSRILSVKREDSTEDARRMDLFIQTDKDYIIIENKINAEDQFRQIQDYKDFVEEKYAAAEKVFIVYLTLNGKLPTEKSISKEALDELIMLKRFSNLSYEEDIITWLSNLSTKKEEKVLEAAIVQYIDVLMGITNQRKEVFNMNQELSMELYKEYANLTRDELRKKLITVYNFQNSVNLLLFINLFEDIYKEAAGKILLLCNEKCDYKNLEEWKEDVLKKQKRFGVRFIGNGITKDLFVSDLPSNKFVFAFSTDKEDISGFGNAIDEPGYAAAVQPTAWFINAIFAARDDWEKSNGRLSTHIVKHWFYCN